MGGGLYDAYAAVVDSVMSDSKVRSTHRPKLHALVLHTNCLSPHKSEGRWQQRDQGWWADRALSCVPGTRYRDRTPRVLGPKRDGPAVGTRLWWPSRSTKPWQKYTRHSSAATRLAGRSHERGRPLSKSPSGLWMGCLPFHWVACHLPAVLDSTCQHAGHAWLFRLAGVAPRQ